MAAFNAINEHYYNSELEKPVITFKEGKKKKAYGWIETRKQWVQGKNERYDINISVDYLGNRSVDETISTLMHEMAHLQKFKETAEAHGLHIEYSEHIGWSLTSLPEETRAWIKENINIKDIRIYKRIAEKDSGKETKPKQSMRKLICPNCGAIARVTSPDTLLICGSCYNEEAKVFYLQEEF